ncbi:MAG: NAD(P)H-dependent glycerol-3-phosphate dehydrogenase [Clostridia bacterium]|nr:NAD(P)H-dependent glycerol-3-phosphate dehydrogenase [Clostridia bacterium]
MKSITVLGAGTWGTALAAMLSEENGCDVTLWSAIESEIKSLRETHKHPNLDGLVLNDNIVLEADLKTALEGADIVIFAVPSPYVRETAKRSAPYIGSQTIIVDVAKGFEKGTHMTLCEVIADELGDERGGIVALSGPTHAEEVSVGLPTAIVAASSNISAAEDIQHTFSNKFFRVYTNSDIKGIEICGAMKNIIAIAAGISEGLGCGDNAKAAIITRGMAEITRLGVALGCSQRTFESLAGIGDLVVTCTSRHSRNNRTGYLIGKGMTAENAAKEVGMAVEGLNALPCAIEFAEKYNVELPICEMLNKIVQSKLSAKEALSLLMTRDLKSED